MAKRSRRKARLAPRPVPVPTDEAVARLKRFLRERFRDVTLPVTHASRVRTLDNDGFAADLQLFDGERCVLIVRHVEGRKPEERWYMRGKYKPDGPASFIFDIIRQDWVRYYPDEAEDEDEDD